MKDKEYFYRDDFKTYKKKFLKVCNSSEFSINKFSELNNKTYISRIEIKDKEL